MKKEKSASGIIGKQLIISLVTVVLFIVAAVLFLTMPIDEKDVDTAIYGGVLLRNDGSYWTVVDTSSGNRGTLQIPKEFNGKPVDKIEKLSDKGTLTIVVIPETVWNIEADAFDSLTALEKIFVAQGNRFYKSESGVLISGEGDRLIKVPENYKFGKTAYFVPEGVETIGAKAFKNCKLTSVALSQTVKILEDSAFYGCASLTSVEGTESSELIALGKQCFYNCTRLSKITLPESVINIGAKCFYNCSGLSGIEISPNNKSYREVDGMLVSMDGERFIACAAGDRRETVSLPEGVKSVGEGAFSGNSYLLRIDLPESLETFKLNSLYGCEALTGIVVKSDKPPVLQSDVGEALPTVAFFVKEEVADAFITSESWSGIRVLTSDLSGDFAWTTVEKLKDYDLIRYLELVECGAENGDAVITACFTRGEITVPDNIETSSGEVKVVGSTAQAFSQAGTTGITFGNNYLCVGEDFAGYSSIKKVRFGTALRKISKEAFMNCTSLQRVEFESPELGTGRLSFVGENAFSGCTSLEYAEFPKLGNSLSETIIVPGCFMNCPKLKTVILYGKIGYSSVTRKITDAKSLILVVPDELESYYFTVRHYSMWGIERDGRMITMSSYESGSFDPVEEEQ